MTSTIKVNNVQNQCGQNIINENSNTITIGASGDTVSLASGASQSGFGRTGTVDWDTTPKTGTFTAVSGDGFFANTTSGGFTMNLPAGVAGGIVSVADYAETWDTGNLTVSPNGSDKIGGINANVTLDTKGQSVTFLFVDSTQGWINIQDSTSNERGNAFITATGGTITCSGNCRIHTFTGPGTFCVSAISPVAANNEVSYVVVGGGGGGGGNAGGGGGGGGGYRETKSPVTPYTASPLDGQPSAPNRITVTATAFPITVGGGGAAGVDPSPGPSQGCRGTNGVNSTFSTITGAGGGGGGGAAGTSNINAQGRPGGSGGGGGFRYYCGNRGEGGTGNTPPVTPAQGTNGGAGAPSSSPTTIDSGGGGGGATAAGTQAGNNDGGDGGAGATSSITGSPVARAGGGGGGSEAGPCGSGGAGGGGDGGTNGNNGTVNTGGGAGGASGASAPNQGGVGGSGIVIIRYKKA